GPSDERTDTDVGCAESSSAVSVGLVGGIRVVGFDGDDLELLSEGGEGGEQRQAAKSCHAHMSIRRMRVANVSATVGSSRPLGKLMKISLCLLLLAASLTQAQKYTYSSFGPPPGATSFNVVGIDNAGEILVTYDDAAKVRHTALRSADGSTYTPIDAPG